MYGTFADEFTRKMDVQEAIDLLTYDLISQDTHCPNEVSYKF
jgi:hypothetical protein